MLATAFFVSAQGKGANPVFIKINGNEVSKDEFLRIYNKNNTSMMEVAQQKSVKDYLDLFINFKLKVIEAQAQGLDTAKAFVDELSGYRKELAKPYLTDISFQEQMIEEAYKHSNTEVNASHILIMCKPDALPADTLKAWNKAIEAREKYKVTGDWDKVAVAYSEEPRIEESKGNLGYFSGFQMVYPFEKAAFDAEVGEITMPIRSRFGYHLILVHDKRPSLGQIKVAHIMKMFKPNMTEDQKIGLKDSIDLIYQKVLAGEDFATLATKYSEDRRSASKGGEMEWFDRHSFRVTEFTTPAYALEKNGDISTPVRTNFGWHIIKRIDFKPSPKLEEVRKDLEKKVKDDPLRSKHSKDSFVEKIKKEYNFKEVSGSKEKFYDLAAEYVTKEKQWKELPSTIDLNLTLFTYDDQLVTQADFMEYLKGEKNADSTSVYIDKSYSAFVAKSMLDYEDKNLEKKYPDFRYLVNEYHDGILLFNITDKNVWGKAVQDSLGLQKFYDAARDTIQKRDEFIWGDRYRGKIYRCTDAESFKKLENLLSNYVEDQDILIALNPDSTNTVVSVEEGAWEEGANPVIDYFIYEGKVPKGEKVDLIKVTGNPTGPEPKTLEDARGLYISEYQNYLEQQWLRELRKKHKVKVSKKVLKKICKEEARLNN